VVQISVGVDIGGTFTDIVLVDGQGTRFFGKSLTTPQDPSHAVLSGLINVLESAGLHPGSLKSVIHGTTLVTNALIERKGVPTGLLTTAGFRDCIEIGTESRYDIFDLQLTKPEPLVERRLRFGIKERVLVDGSVLEPLDESQARGVIEELVALGVESIGVCLLHSYANPTHEIRLRELLTEIAPHIRVSISSEVSPEIREYPRSCTTIANVYIQPLVEKYLGVLNDGLRGLKFEGELLIMLSSGGTGTLETAKQFPIGLLESGPVGGAVAASFYGNAHGLGDLVVFDMGGTTAKISVLEDGEPSIVHEFEVARCHRFKKGSGLPVTIPVIDMIEIGAGGGSIARVDRMGRLKIGPDSAGSEPGPVCYGHGGKEPTVTDANLVLGYLDPDFFLGGKMKIDLEAAQRAVEHRIARPLGISTMRAAWGILHIVTENMANAARIHAAERGKDLRNYSLFAFGGAGPLHASYLADALHMSRVIVPSGAGVLSAFGFLTVPLSFDFSRTHRGSLAELDWDRVNTLLAQMEQEGRQIIGRSLSSDRDVTITRSCEARYVGQSHQIAVPVPDGVLGPQTNVHVMRNFVDGYRELYEYDEGEGEALPIEVLTWRVKASGPKPHVRIEATQHDSDVAARKPDRRIYLPERGEFGKVPVFDRYALGAGFVAEGPLIVEERESTLVVPLARTLMIDDFKNLIVTRGKHQNGHG
jgi:N-methylhydantoinase A